MSQIIRATLSPVVPAHGNTRKVARSGRRYMSDSSMRTKPSIDDPSNMILPSSASSNWPSGISTFLMVPRMSVNWRRMNLTFSRSVRSRICALVSFAPPGGAKETKAQILERTEREKVKFMRLQFTDILGTIKNVEIPDGQFEEALDGRIMFDGSSIEGFVRIEESDMYLRPDLATFRVFPWPGTSGENVARMICDIYTPDGQPFAGCPRTMLKKVIAQAASRGFAMKAGPEAEFFLFQTRNGVPT